MLRNLITPITITALSLCVLNACDSGQPTPEEPTGRWQKIIEIHPTDRTKAVQMMITADNHLPSQNGQAALVLSCQIGETDAYVIWRQYLGAYDLKVTWRAGSESEVVERWTLSSDSEAIFAPNPIEFIKQLMIYDELLIKTTPFGSEPLTLVFNTEGLDQEVGELRKACKW
jgi:hypothetical protein